VGGCQRESKGNVSNPLLTYVGNFGYGSYLFDPSYIQISRFLVPYLK
jgi:hypothetical protein